MTGLTQITVPIDLLKNWEDRFHDDNENVDVLLIEAYEAGHRAGADQELEACKQVIMEQQWFAAPGFRLDQLHNARRPKPTLKQQALEALDRMWTGVATHADWDLFRRALEALPDD